ncbi:MAG: hypothetical protein KDC38_21190, partial [Planctomycetes bacterium]|nr:hypothetical protein [Planctomycetota bacterium]
MLRTMIAITVLLGLTQPSPTPLIGPKTWNLEGVDSRFKSALEAWQDGAYEVARDDIELLVKAKGDARLEGDDVKKAKFLLEVAEDAIALRKLVDSEKYSYKKLLAARNTTLKYRETFAYFLMLDLEEQYRKLGVQPVLDFEPPREMYEVPKDPVRLFDRVTYPLRGKISALGVTDDAKW